MALVGGACRKFVSIDPQRNQIVTAEVFADSANATAAVIGIYVKAVNISTNFSFGNGAVTLCAGLSADELAASNATPDEAEIASNSITPQNERNRSLWTSAYPLIYQMNACIEELRNNTAIRLSLRDQLLGEVLFMRGYFYFYLSQLFGDVPLVLSTRYTENARLPRTPVSQVFSQIVQDLGEAEQLLPAAYPSSGRLRPNKYAATSLLARIHLYLQQWQPAEEESSRVIASGIYTLEADLNKVFLTSSNEAIFQLRPIQPGYGTAEGAIFNPGTSASSLPKYTLTPYLLSAFEAGDLRKARWVNSKTVNGTPYAYPYKYKLTFDNGSTPAESYVLLRLAEQYLIRAEARLRRNNPAGAVADLNLIRSRAGLPDITSADPATIAASIEQERRVELFAEWGHRWFDLKRLNRADAVLGIIKAPGWQTTSQLYPIPFYEIAANPALTQNPGY
jgi:hypothetical protein